MEELTQDQIEELREDFEFNDGDNDGRIQFAEFAELMALLEADMDAAGLPAGFSRDRHRR